MLQTKPLVSIVVTVFNKACYLPHVINSFNTQKTTYSMELIFVDDASTDNSIAVLEQASKQQNNIHIIRNSQNSGPALRLNQGLSIANGNYILLVDGDDLLADTTVNTMVSLLKSSRADMLYGQYGGRVLEHPNCSETPQLNPSPKHRIIEHPLQHIILNRQIGMGVMITRDLLTRFTGCDEAIFVQDITLHLELGKSSQRLVLLDEPFMFGFKDNNTSLSTLDDSQGLHDRVLSYYRFFLKNENLLDPHLVKGMVNTCISAMWKYHKRRSDISTGELLNCFLLYIRNKTGLFIDPTIMMSKSLHSFDTIKRIRRVPNSHTDTCRR